MRNVVIIAIILDCSGKEWALAAKMGAVVAPLAVKEAKPASRKGMLS